MNLYQSSLWTQNAYKNQDAQYNPIAILSAGKFSHPRIEITPHRRVFGTSYTKQLLPFGIRCRHGPANPA